MDILLHQSKLSDKSSKIQITGSKSESNRLLLLQALYQGISLENVSNSDDSVLMQKALASKENVIDIHHAGTAMRFLTAYFATQIGRTVELTGSKRMKERPIGILVEALKQLGAEINYIENEGFPPLLIKGKTLTKHKVTLKANVSSQYISALLLIAPKLENGLELTLEGEITSVPYINMTLSLLNEIGVETSFNKNTIIVKPKELNKNSQNHLTVESDWSSASYYFSCAGLSEIGTQIEIASYKNKSLQGDSVLVELYQNFGVSAQFSGHTLQLKKTNHPESSINFNLKNAPDIAQTIVVTAFGLGLKCDLYGLHTLKIKETDRLVALKTELEKFGAKVEITKDSLHLEASNHIKSNVSIETYNDHRMAMAFAPLALKTNLVIKDAEVVSKSYPTFWRDFKNIGFLTESNNN
ncbi:3-phosphoshikimate 1-carboxyvinyltransferase [Aurantibacter aestuarii]|uniref:3-phosphoshikimate 1-carboxyvinyltransferase n=1 Tax=Aurantibacter aestuarii TaxID=1266046 RepID=A0A2T1NEB2_9FLAO|nr:3-phosphoshikimate 1-carboxyvinyltransferase [Aurantibacter aestuarii]PSG90791.1 3-phosphoshikimate 1-carboxyvinyltransferase [Aurantibacter aestuarii]